MRALLLTAALLLVPLAAGQDHEHASENGIAYALRDGPPDGRATVGAYTHFGFALLDKDAKPTPHQNAEFVVTQDGRVVFSTTDTHEYDGLFGFDVTFTKPGPYQVVAMSGEMETGVFEGTVVEPVNETVATIELTATPQGPASRVVDFELAIVDASGAILPHTDASIVIRAARDGFLLSRTHLHIHEEPIRFTQALGPDTDYVVHVVGYRAFNRGTFPDVRAVVAQFPVSVGPVAAPAAPSPELAPPAVLEQVGPTATADGLTLHLMFDPNQQLGLAQLGRIAAVVVDDANHSPLQHVNFAMALTGPRGLVFATESGHEYDGVFELQFRPDAPGPYDGSLTATYGDTELTVPIHLLVVPPAVPLLGGTGLVDVAVDGLDGAVAGKEANLTFAATSAAGPAKHSEVDVVILREGEAPLYQFKLHTHDSGLTNAVLSFPEEGTWIMRIDPLPTVPEASLYPPVVLSFDVAPGDPSTVLPVGGLEKEKLEVPGIPLAPLMAALIAVAMLRRSRA